MSRHDRLARFVEAFEVGADVHLNNAGVAPMCRPAVAAVEACAARMARGTLAMGDLLEDLERARATFARLVGARPNNVSMMQTCAAALTQVALGLPLADGAEIVTWDQEYPSNAYPWFEAARRVGGRVVAVPSGADLAVDTGRLIEAITTRTGVVATSWVQFQTGAITDLERLAAACRRVGAWLVVDAIQGLGVLPLDLEALGIDAVCGGTHKWLCGPVGHGFIAFREGRRDEVWPLMHGAITYGTPDEPPVATRSPRCDPRRFEPGTPLLLGSLAGAAAIELILDTGVDTLRARALELSDRLVEGVRARGGRVLSQTSGAVRSPITTFVPRGDLDAAARRLQTARVSFSRRGGGIRISPHGFNREADIDRVLEALDGSF